MEHSDLALEPSSSKRTLAILLTILLWLVSVILTVICIFAAREIILLELAILIPQEDTLSRLQAANFINLVHQCTLPILGIIGVVVMILSSELMFNQAGTPRTLRRLTLIIAAECLIVVPVWFFLWRP
jgi:hypothetical protein